MDLLKNGIKLIMTNIYHVLFDKNTWLQSVTKKRIHGYNLFVGTIQFQLTSMDLSHETNKNTCETRTRI